MLSGPHPWPTHKVLIQGAFVTKGLRVCCFATLKHQVTMAGAHAFVQQVQDRHVLENARCIPARAPLLTPVTPRNCRRNKEEGQHKVPAFASPQQETPEAACRGKDQAASNAGNTCQTPQSHYSAPRMHYIFSRLFFFSRSLSLSPSLCLDFALSASWRLILLASRTLAYEPTQRAQPARRLSTHKPP